MSSFEESFRFTTIDKIRKKRLSVKLIDQDGDEVPVKEASKNILKYLGDKLTDAENSDNQIVNQILPLCAQSMVATLPEIVGEKRASKMLTLSTWRWPLNYMMLISFSMLKLIQQKNLKIVTIEEDISDEEIEKLVKYSNIGEATTIAEMYGHSPREVLKDLLTEGTISMDELVEMVGKDTAQEIASE